VSLFLMDELYMEGAPAMAVLATMGRTKGIFPVQERRQQSKTLTPEESPHDALAPTRLPTLL